MGKYFYKATRSSLNTNGKSAIRIIKTSQERTTKCRCFRVVGHICYNDNTYIHMYLTQKGLLVNFIMTRIIGTISNG